MTLHVNVLTNPILMRTLHYFPFISYFFAHLMRLNEYIISVRVG